jgi:hypothetical protein
VRVNHFVGALEVSDDPGVPEREQDLGRGVTPPLKLEPAREIGPVPAQDGGDGFEVKLSSGPNSGRSVAKKGFPIDLPDQDRELYAFALNRVDEPAEEPFLRVDDRFFGGEGAGSGDTGAAASDSVMEISDTGSAPGDDDSRLKGSDGDGSVGSDPELSTCGVDPLGVLNAFHDASNSCSTRLRHIKVDSLVERSGITYSQTATEGLAALKS